MTALAKKQAKRLQRLYGGKQALVTSFLPKGRSGQYIYAVTVNGHPDKVKIGMTTNWKNRRNAYLNWNLSTDAIVSERVFRICEEFVDLSKLENHILKTFEARAAHGNEWFYDDIEAAARHIDRVMCEHNISYDLLCPSI